MLEKIIAKVLSGKWIMTIAFTVTTCYLAWIGKISAEVFVPLVTMIVTSYFNKEKVVKQ
jgi:hypothetical protein